MQRVAKEDVLRLQIAMNDLVLLKQVQRAEELLGEPSDQFQRESAEGVGFDELVEVHVEELGGDAEMAAEVEAMCKVDHAVLAFWVL